MSAKGSCKEAVLDYLTIQNRPYSANDVTQNLHKEFGKTAVQKALDDLTSENKIKEKNYGKQKVYSVIQKEEKGEVALELVTLDSKIQEVSEEVKSVEQKLKEAQGELKELENEPSTEQALKEKVVLEEFLLKLGEKIECLSKASFGVTEDEKITTLKIYENCTKERKKRKQMCLDIVNSIMESYPKKLKVLFEEIGIEEDENA